MLPVATGGPAGLDHRDPGDRLRLTDKRHGRELLKGLHQELDVLQRRLWAEATRAVLLVLQGMDCSGKDGTIRRVLSGLNPQGCHVVAFRVPEPHELAHDYLWRVHGQCPARGQLGVFNRSHYEDVVVARVAELVDGDRCRRRYRHLRDFEQLLADEGTTIVKVFLHLSRDEQRERLQKRLDDPERRWKFDPDDLRVRAHWDAYQAVYEEALSETSTDVAPWWVVPADHKWVRDVAVASLLVETFRRLDPRYPPPDPRLDGLVVT